MSEDDQTVEALIRPSRPLHRVSVRVARGKAAGRSVELLPGQPVSIGKSPDNQLHIDDMTVSRYHVELTLRRGAIEVRDLESMNGTYIGEARIARALVRPGTELTVGASTIALVAEDSGAVMPRPEPERESDELPELPGVIANSPAMRKVVQTITRLAASQVTVLLHGETGTGKEVLARSLHELSDRKKQPFEVVDCGSMAPTLIASELFGHDRGAFTGAHGEHAGAFERAHGGTVFLDEIGELPLDLQPMLLGVLERRRFKRVGGVKERNVDVRVIAATHRDLRNATNVGTFRADLYFRLAVARVEIPPLRERPEDIAALVRRFAEQVTGDPDAQPFDRQTLRALEAHPWSGNVRELRNVVESAVALGAVQLESGLGPDADGGGVVDPAAASGDLLGLPYREARAQAVAAFERTYLSKLSEACNGNASEAARRAKMDRPYLLGLLRKHGLR
ncbi:MAG: sigma 54-interacting transcriptional regulator [Polyangiales bacterium]